MLHVAGNHVHLACHAPEEFLDHGSCAQVEQSQAEEVECLFAYLQSVVPVLEEPSFVYLVVDFVKVAHEFVLIVTQLVLVIVPLWQTRCLKHFEHKHRVMSREAASALGDDVGVLYFVFVASVNELINRVVDILLDGVVHAVLARAVTGAVVIHAKTTANVDEVDVKA